MDSDFIFNFIVDYYSRILEFKFAFEMVFNGKEMGVANLHTKPLCNRNNN